MHTREIPLTGEDGTLAPRWHLECSAGNPIVEGDVVTFSGSNWQATTPVQFISSRPGKQVTVWCTAFASRPAVLFVLTRASNGEHKAPVLYIQPSVTVQRLQASFTVAEGASTLGFCPLEEEGGQQPDGVVQLLSLSLSSPDAGENASGRGLSLEMLKKFCQANPQAFRRSRRARARLGRELAAKSKGRDTKAGPQHCFTHAGRQLRLSGVGVSKREGKSTEWQSRRQQRAGQKMQKLEVLALLESMQLGGDRRDQDQEVDMDAK